MALHRLTRSRWACPTSAETAAYYTDFGLTPDGDGLVRRPGRRRAAADRARPHPAAGRAGRRRRRRRRPRPRRRQPAPDGRRRRDRHRPASLRVEPVTGVRATRRDRAPHGRSPRSRPPPTTVPGGLERTGTAPPASCGRPGATAQAGPRRDRLHRPRPHAGLLHRRPRLQGQRLRQGDRRVHALLHRPPQRPRPARPGRPSCTTPPGRSTTSTRSAAAPRPCWRTTPSGTSGASGRHHAGSNFFWYLKDPAGNFSEYYSDMDCIVDDAALDARDASKAPRASSTGARRRRRPSSTPTTSPP